MPPAPALCICMPQGRINRVLAECTQKSIFSAIHHCSTNATVELAEAKKSGSPVILLVHDNIGHDAIKFMCADVHATPRQVQWIYSLSTGVDPYKLPELQKELANIPVYNARKCHGDILAEHVLFSMLHFNRQPWRLVASKAAKLWDQYNMVGLRGQKVGIFGYGDIGRACGRAAAAMGMEVTGIRRTASDVDVDEYGVRVRTDAAADEVIRTSDFIVGVLPGTPSTVHFFNRDFFSRMKPGAVFINIGRGASQCEDDLVQALQAGTIRGAALDVFEKEPLPESSPLWNLPDDKVLLSPHCADMREDLIGVSVRRFESLVEKYINGASFATEYRVNLEHGY